jgi:hypothetical protein
MAILCLEEALQSAIPVCHQPPRGASRAARQGSHALACPGQGTPPRLMARLTIHASRKCALGRNASLRNEARSSRRGAPSTGGGDVREHAFPSAARASWGKSPASSEWTPPRGRYYLAPRTDDDAAARLARTNPGTARRLRRQPMWPGCVVAEVDGAVWIEGVWIEMET